MFGGVPDDDPEGDAFVLRQEDEPGCPLCDARDGEPHQPECSLFMPECRCGRPARRMVDGEWFCTTCAPSGRVKGRAA